MHDQKQTFIPIIICNYLVEVNISLCAYFVMVYKIGIFSLKHFLNSDLKYKQDKSKMRKKRKYIKHTE